jgi:hypothetical protein
MITRINFRSPLASGKEYPNNSEILDSVTGPFVYLFTVSRASSPRHPFSKSSRLVKLEKESGRVGKGQQENWKNEGQNCMVNLHSNYDYEKISMLPA